MKTGHLRLLGGASAVAMSLGLATTADAQTAPPSSTIAAAAQVAAQTADQAATTPSEQDIVVTGVRESLRSAQAIKRNANQIVDSVNAQDIGKLPDANTVEALQRITGVQIQRRYGEGATDFDHRTTPAITVRGLTQVSNFIDGRAAISASGGRTLDLEAVPPELLAGIDVFKNPPASTIEGDVAGVVNIRTRLPFDQPGQLISATFKGNYYDRADKFGGSVSGLYSNRFETGIGEMGFLLNGSYAKSSYRQDAILIGAFGPIPAGITIPGAPANAQVPYGEQIYDDGGDRKRLGIAGAWQWQAAPNLLVTAQALYSRYKFFRQGKYYYYNNNGNATTTPLNGANFTFDSAGYATSGSLANQVFESARFDQDLTNTTGNYTLSAKWDVTDRLHAVFDAQYLKSSYNADRNGFVISLYDQTGQTPYTAKNQSIVDFDLRGSRPVWNVRNPALLSDPNNYAFTYMADSITRNDADQLALKYDLEYDVEGGFLQKLRGGLRYADSTIDLRGTWNGFCLLPSGPNPSCSSANGLPFVRLSQFPELALKGPTPNFFDGRTLPGGILYPNFEPGSSLWDSLVKTEAKFGATPKSSFSPGDLNHQTERTLATYLTADYAGTIGGIRIDGNAGVRVVRTRTGSAGTIFNSDGTQAPINVQREYVKALPSFNIRARLTDTLQSRFAYSKSFARPNFDQMATNVSLNAPNIIGFTQRDANGNVIAQYPTGSSGNPYLRPITSDNFDLTTEWYFAPTGSVTFGAFYKKVDGFLAGGTTFLPFNGVTYAIGTTVNTGRGTVKGVEAAYQQFFDFLPGLLSGLGVQANYTYVDSSVTNPFATAGSNVPTTVPLEKLSKHSYNLVGLYEKGPVTARLAWSWRGKYFDTTQGSGANNQVQFQKPYASLDASISYNFSAHLALSVDAVNLTNRMNLTYINTLSQPLQYTLNDRRFGFSLRATY
ncbi:TonB-dependent receptor [Sphingomonas sp. MA1305]|uniref:TonB-dependent receptor n=1 Tax=Sphingomonas sp. MA1305 TaxID=2479204 RepID=UPI001E50A8CB|nr:TonB-dependent receptor [Sphingomonas sp. MA1305]MBI0475521.1 TonB-dependent receptor [Sphingomonas sp. MA1305]